MDITAQLAEELNVKTAQVQAAVGLLDEGATVPFIARYRKEVTGGLDDLQLRELETRLRYLREMEERRQVILDSIGEQEKLTPQLEKQIRAAQTKTELEDLYLPFKPKRRTRGMIAIEAGLEPLADRLYADPGLDPAVEAESFVDADKGVADVKAALEGARYILMERFSEDAGLAGRLRTYLWENGVLQSKVLPDKEKEAAKFQDYFEYEEALGKIPSHRALAVFRGRKEGFLTLAVASRSHDQVEKEPDRADPCEVMVARHLGIEDQGRPGDGWLREMAGWTWRVKLLTRLEVDLLGQLREQAEDEAIRVFAQNLKAILLASPAGGRVTMGLDPGLRTGVKVSIVDATGKYLEDTAIYPHAPRNQWDQSIATLAAMCKKYAVELISIGNGTASRETDRLAGDLIKRHPELTLRKVMVNEAGASVYSASDTARQEFPDLDVTVRGAISIARRLQDPLAELVKIEPRSIGVGQYQHDVSQVKLGQSLDAVVEDCVNAVGVDVNMASAPLLARVAGLTPSLARNIVEFRNQHGRFQRREDLKAVPRFGDKSFEQAAGFLRIVDGDNPLDASAVHPESYRVVEKIITLSQRHIGAIIGDSSFLKRLDPAAFTDEQFGLPTVTDILAELEKPGRDPRPEFKTADFRDGVETLADLKPDMVLEGVITNVTNFGAFVDIGVHQDGLVHISALANHFVKDPHTVVKTGDVVRVKVLEVDQPRKRISLTMRLDDTAAEAKKSPASAGVDQRIKEPRGKGRSRTQAPAKTGSLGDLLQAALNKQ
ncbi:MAG: Tex family protein [Gammaproteobacteria bacterium]|nr:RNA-binding transcriptional accessory protein [Pseudomonadales bacterium]MCP5348761.1 RNA-binding transcriptional accessory protein [Pseudomonadales bacterium]